MAGVWVLNVLLTGYKSLFHQNGFYPSSPPCSLSRARRSVLRVKRYEVVSRTKFPRWMGGVEKTTLSMKLHLAERDPQHHAWAKRGVDKKQMKLKILLSYWYYKNVDLDALFAKYFTKPYPEVFAVEW